jgi:hypothetical protein
MSYGEVLGRAWNIIWEHKFLIILGVIVALGSGSGGGGSSGANLVFNQPSQEGPAVPPFPQIPEMPDMRTLAPIAVILVILAVIAAVAFGLLLWAVATIARGGLIDGVNTVDEGGASSFAQAWRAGWRKGWRLLGIGILPAIPAFLLAILGVGGALAFGGVARYMGREIGMPISANLGILVAVLACILVPFAVVLQLLSTFANRACMLEDLGVFGSYRRGARVLLDNLGPAIVLFLIQIGIGIVIAILGFLPGILFALCCLLWPLLILVQGAISAYFSTMWTLAWRNWTGLSDVGEPAIGVPEV